MSAHSPLKIGVLLVAPNQLLDVAAVDLLGMCTPEYLAACELPAPLVALGVPMSIIYISESGAGTFVECTAYSGLKVNAGLEDEATAPGKFDILMIPGPDPSVVPSEKTQEFVRKHAKSEGTTIMTVCTGVMVAAHSGILKGKRATGPRALLGKLKKSFPDTQWVDKRWEIDGNIRSSAGITNGMDMTAAYIREKWPGPLADAVLYMADVGYRSVDYEQSQVQETSWFLWVLLRAWWRGPSKPQTKPRDVKMS